MSMRMPRRENLPAAGRLHYCGLPRPQGGLIGLKAGHRLRCTDNQERDTRNQIFMHFLFHTIPCVSGELDYFFRNKSSPAH
ncbi:MULTISPECIES: hypothetical protein [unclassified Microbulbifer]|uniref:hypothetical protein n=1 Tax=unclassified Microbulbifer TaxID=2619833 RepID=UPI0027E507E0|nr:MULTISPECIES: hypothetical protein [unclassified Microbulbifer]